MVIGLGTLEWGVIYVSYGAVFKRILTSIAVYNILNKKT